MGDLLLFLGGKQRTNPYNSFVLSHLGYWTDNGAYYYHTHTNYSNAEEALVAVKYDLLRRNIPVRYFQWDDWWMESEGDRPGILSWIPKPEVFPSGFANWLNMSLSLYAPEYSARNRWTKMYDWKIDGETAIPLDDKFYKDLFLNGSKIGMKMFEQDFLCSINSETNLTSSDVTSGNAWMMGMDNGAIATNTSLQWCMMNPCHALASTQVKQMTNGRGTGDNCRGNSKNIESMGKNGLLYFALGFFPSRDNVWTTDGNTEQPQCNRFCFQPNRHADNAVALLSGGPYGPSDAVGYTDRSVVMYACRTDGVLLRPSWPLSSLDVSFTSLNHQGLLLWAAHDDHSDWRWSYLLLINSDEEVQVHPGDIQNIARPLVGWQVSLGKSVESVERFYINSTITLNAAPAQPHGPGLTHVSFAPVFPNGMAILGDIYKWATMSTRRFVNLQYSVARQDITSVVIGAPGEEVSIFYVSDGEDDVRSISCQFNSNCSPPDKFGDIDCSMLLRCARGLCVCVRRGF